MTGGIPPSPSRGLLQLPTFDKKVLAACVLLFLFTLLLYSRAIRNGFVNYDDPAYVTQNFHVLQGLTLSNVRWAFTTTSEANWHPLTWLSHMADVSAFGGNPAGHHFSSVFLHACSVVLLFLLLYSATQYFGRSILVSFLFAVHPLNVETVAWVAERKSVLSTLFFFLAIGAYGVYLHRKSIPRYLWICLFFVLGLMSKPMVITLPCLLLLLDCWPFQRIALPDHHTSWNDFLSCARNSLIEKIPLFFIAAASAIITVVSQHRGGAVGHAAVLPLGFRIANALLSYVLYIVKAFWPVRLAVFYPHPQGRLSLLIVLLSGFALLSFTVLCWRWRAHRYLFVGWLWYLIALLPVIGIVQVGRQAMADRYAYIPLIGVFILLVWAAAEGLQARVSPSSLRVLSAAIVLGYVSVTLVQIGYWRNSYLLFAHTLQVTSENSTAELNFGKELADRGQNDLAEAHFRNAIQYSPDLGVARYNLATLLQRENRTDDALQQYLLALPRMSDPLELAQTHNNLGALFLARNQYAEALAQFDSAIYINPDEANSYLGRGMVQFQSGQVDNALASFSKAAEIAPSALAWYWTGRCLEARGDKDLAIRAYQSALRLSPRFGAVHSQLERLQNSTK
jgi:Tfp pilus assembly protein PilF